MGRILKKHAQKRAAAETDFQRMNTVCLPPFEENGVTMYSHLCQVGRERHYPLFTYVYAPDKETAQKILDENYSDFDFRKVG